MTKTTRIEAFPRFARTTEPRAGNQTKLAPQSGYVSNFCHPLAL